MNHLEKRVAAFFYGSFIRRDVLAAAGFNPETIEVARLSGYDIDFDPHANVFRSEQHTVCGILVYPSHQELDRLCYMPPFRKWEARDLAYVKRIHQIG